MSLPYARISNQCFTPSPKIYILAAFFTFSITAYGQNLYFPPLSGNTWQTVSPTELGWCVEQLDSVYAYLEETDTKGFIILHNGRIAAERYFGSFTENSQWYWASAGKTLTAFLVGQAQQEGLLDINQPTSTYLGSGWTNLPPDKEALITVRHQLTMSTGLDDGVPNNFCTLPACLEYKADAGTRWAYHNAPYTLLTNVLGSATGQGLNPYFNSRIRNRIGMNGLWIQQEYNEVYFSNTRSMARFGLLIQNRGVWAADTLLRDAAYFDAMVNTSQPLNQSYGYLWWLNGKASFRLPGLQINFPGPLMANAPADLIAGLGLNDQKVYVIPSLNMVVVRLGESAGTPAAAASSFDNILWGKLMQVFCNVSNTNSAGNTAARLRIVPNPTTGQAWIEIPDPARNFHIAVRDKSGRLLLTQSNRQELDLQSLPAGVYFITVRQEGFRRTQRLVKQ